MKFARKLYRMAVPVKQFFYSVCQSVSHSTATHMFECFVRSHVCLSVSPSTHRKQLTCVNVAFYLSWVLGGRDVGLSLDLCFGGGGSVV